MPTHHPLTIALTLGALGAMTLLALNPKPGIHLEGEVAMLEPSVALQRLNQSEDVAVQRNLVLTHAALALDAGDFGMAGRVLQRLGDTEKAPAEIELMMAEASRLSGDAAAEADHLAAAYARTPTSVLRQQLGLSLREIRAPLRERALLMSVDPSSLTSHEARRLADLLRKDRQFAGLESLYRARAFGDGPDADTAKQHLITLLLESGRMEAAEHETLRWFEAADRDQHILETALPAFVNWGALDGAMRLALSVLQVAPKSSFRLILVFLDGGHPDRALAFQQAWIAQSRSIPAESWPTLISVAERTGILDGLRASLAMTSPDGLSPDIIASAMLQFLRYQGVRALYAQAAFLRPDVLRHQPLIGAAWAADQGNQIEAVTYLHQAATKELSTWDLQIWGNIAASLRGSRASQALLSEMPVNSNAGSVLAMAFMDRRMPQDRPESAGKGD